MVSIGILGVGSRWDDRYRPALENLKDHIRVAAVYDVVAARARLLAEKLQVPTEGGMLALAQRREVQAVLLLDPDWAGAAALELLCHARKPVYLAARPDSSVERIRQLHQFAASEGFTVMPEFGRRYTPAANRLQELFATHLGRPHRITIPMIQHVPQAESSSEDVLESSFRDVLTDWFDWCRYMFRSVPTRLVWDRSGGARRRGGGNEFIRTEFSHGRTKSSPAPSDAVAEFRLRPPADSQAAALDPTVQSSPRIEVTCERGTAVLDGMASVSWQVNSEQHSEILSSDRSEVEVMLDQFCRRVVGGLVPVADLNDVCCGMEMAAAAEKSLRTGQPVRLDAVL